MDKTVKEAIEYLSAHVTLPTAGMIADLIVASLEKTLGEDILNKKLEKI